LASWTASILHPAASTKAAFLPLPSRASRTPQAGATSASSSRRQDPRDMDRRRRFSTPPGHRWSRCATVHNPCSLVCRGRPIPTQAIRPEFWGLLASNSLSRKACPGSSPIFFAMRPFGPERARSTRSEGPQPPRLPPSRPILLTPRALRPRRLGDFRAVKPARDTKKPGRPIWDRPARLEEAIWKRSEIDSQSEPEVPLIDETAEQLR